MIVVTGATGQLGRLVIAALLERSVPASGVVAAVRTPEKAAELAALGVQVRVADYDRPDTLASALDGAEKVLLVSGTDPFRRVAQHQAVVDAAKAAGVRLLAYTSILHADTVPLALAPHHKATEEYILSSGLPYSFLRNNLYSENYLAALQQALTSGVIVGSARDGRIASATRGDYAAAAAAVLAEEGHENTVHELSGDTSWSRRDLADTASEITGKTITYQDLPVQDYIKILVGAGIPELMASLLAESDVNIADGLLDDTSRGLSRLIGRPTTSLRDALTAALKG